MAERAARTTRELTHGGPYQSTEHLQAVTPHTSVWTGSEMIVWASPGGRGARYNPATDAWTPISTDAQPGTWAPVIWGGKDPDSMAPSGRSTTSTGNAYDPTTDTWRSIGEQGAPSPRGRHTAIWTGREMVVWGGSASSSGFISGLSGGAYDPASDQWRQVLEDGAPSPRCGHTAVWTGQAMLIWGGLAGCAPFGGQTLGDGSMYVQASNSHGSTDFGRSPADVAPPSTQTK
jgi:hypothetical protein